MARAIELCRRLGHPQDWQGFAVGEWDLDEFARDVAFAFVEGYAGEGAAHFEVVEAGGECRCLDVGEDEGAEALPGEVGVDEDGANLGCVSCRI